jgi:hypothetical protein
MTPVTDHQAAAYAVEFAAGTEIRVATYTAAASAEAVARGINSGRIRGYRPVGAFEAAVHVAEEGATVWARFTGGDEVAPLPTSMTVRVPDYGTQTGYEGVRVVTVEISSRCRVCGGPRGPVRPDSFVRDGVRLERDAWTNTCGHRDDYAAVLKEAALFGQWGHGRARPRGGDLRGVTGGRFRKAVNLLAEWLVTSPHMSAVRAAGLLDEAGEDRAAREVRSLWAGSPNGGNTSARSAAMYLIRLDEQAQAEGGTK